MMPSIDDEFVKTSKLLAIVIPNLDRPFKGRLQRESRTNILK
jgi:hypothetical protein